MRTTQNQKVYDYMKEHGGISQRDAIAFRCFRLSARIHDLRADGHLIKSERRAFRSENGIGYYAYYSLAE